MEERDLQKVNKQLEFKYCQIITKFKNISYIALALVLIGTVLLFTIIFAYKQPGLGICVFLIFNITRIVNGLINENLTQLKLKEVKIEESNEEIIIESIVSLYRFSFIVFATDIVACIYLIPFFSNFNYTIWEYYRFLPFLTTLSIFMIIILRIIAHICLKKNSMYQSAGTPLKFFSKRVIYLAAVLLIITFNIYIIMEILVQILAGFSILILSFYGILYLADNK